MTRCAAKTKSGKRCRRSAGRLWNTPGQPVFGFCKQHEPEYVKTSPDELPAMKANRAKIAALFKGVKPYTAAELKKAKP